MAEVFSSAIKLSKMIVAHTTFQQTSAVLRDVDQNDARSNTTSEFCRIHVKFESPGFCLRSAHKIECLRFLRCLSAFDYYIHSMKANHSLSHWRTIVIFDDYGEVLKTYPLDEKARHLMRIRRQKRRNLGRMTGKRGFSLNKFPEDMEVERQPTAPLPSLSQLNCEPLAPQAEIEEQTDTSRHCPAAFPNVEIDLTSIEWLLNPRPQVPAL